MIELEVQFQIVVVSVVFGMICTNLYTFLNIWLGKSKVFRSMCELCFFLSISSVYYYIVFKINKGILSIYMPICLFVGYYLHMRFYDKYFSCFYQYLFSSFHSIIIKRKERCKRVWKGLMCKITKKAKSTE